MPFCKGFHTNLYKNNQIIKQAARFSWFLLLLCIGRKIRSICLSPSHLSCLRNALSRQKFLLHPPDSQSLRVSFPPPLSYSTLCCFCFFLSSQELPLFYNDSWNKAMLPGRLRFLQQAAVDIDASKDQINQQQSKVWWLTSLYNCCAFHTLPSFFACCNSRVQPLSCFKLPHLIYL